MDRFLARLERRFGGLAIENLPMFIVGGMGIVFLITMTRPDFLSLLVFSPQAVLHGQVWRLVTFLFLPTNTSPLWILLDLYLVWLVGSNLEVEWGAFKLNVYYFLGALGTMAAALITGHALGNFFLNASMGFAFATLFPDFQITLFFLIPVKVRWLGWLLFAYVAYEFVVGDWGSRGAILAALANYLLFFSGHIASFARGGRVHMRQAARRSSSAPPAAAVQARACALCGAREADGADIRVCSCEKCKEATGGQARTLCLEHARSH